MLVMTMPIIIIINDDDDDYCDETCWNTALAIHKHNHPYLHQANGQPFQIVMITMVNIYVSHI